VANVVHLEVMSNVTEPVFSLEEAIKVCGRSGQIDR